MLKFASAGKKASKKRAEAEKAGEHIPPFLISSITSGCNLHCAGCYSRSNGATNDCGPKDQLTAAEWRRIFDEAQDLGVSFILLAGGEPLLRWDVINEAAAKPDILFPIFTNGTFIGDKYMDLFHKSVQRYLQAVAWLILIILVCAKCSLQISSKRLVFDRLDCLGIIAIQLF